MPEQPSILIFAQPASLRDSLKVLLSSSSRAKSILLAADLASIQAAEPGYVPALVVFALDNVEKKTLRHFAQISAVWARTPILVMVNNEEEAQQIIAAGAQRVLVHGILAASLIREVDKVLSEAGL